MNQLYQEQLLAFAKKARAPFSEIDATHTAALNNPVCGDTIQITAKIQNDVIIQANIKARGCALCEAGAGVWSETVIGTNLAEQIDMADNMQSYLNGKTAPPTDSASCFEAIKQIKNRFKCVLLAFQAGANLSAINDTSSD